MSLMKRSTESVISCASCVRLPAPLIPDTANNDFIEEHILKYYTYRSLAEHTHELRETEVHVISLT